MSSNNMAPARAQPANDKQSSVLPHSRLRAARLTRAVPAIKRVVRYDRQVGASISEAVLSLYVAAVVELSHLRGELGVLDADRLERIADTMGLPIAEVTPVWNEHKATAEATAERQLARAMRTLTTTGAAKVWHVELVRLKEVAHALDLRAWRKAMLFPKAANGRRPTTGLPTVTGPEPGSFAAERRERAVTYTPEQRKDWVNRLGFRPDTLSHNARTLTAAEFHRRIAKREAELLPPERLASLKHPGESDWDASRRIRREAPKTRKRTHGITAERRALASELGVHPDTVKKKTHGWTIGEIAKLRGNPTRAGQALGLSVNGRPTPDKVVRVTPDMDAKIGHFSHGSRPDYASAGATFQRSIDGSSDIRKPSRGERGPQAYSYAYGPDEAQILHQWYEANNGKPLTEEAARKWHKRGTFDRNLAQACEWWAEHGNDEELNGCAETWLRTFRERRREEARKGKISRALSGEPIREVVHQNAVYAREFSDLAFSGKRHEVSARSVRAADDPAGSDPTAEDAHAPPNSLRR